MRHLPNNFEYPEDGIIKFNQIPQKAVERLTKQIKKTIFIEKNRYPIHTT